MAGATQRGICSVAPAAGNGVVYLPASANVPAFLRDSLYVHVAALRGWKVVAHMRGSDFRELLLPASAAR